MANYPRTFIPPKLTAELLELDRLTQEEYKRLTLAHKAVLLKPILSLPWEQETNVVSFLNNGILKKQIRPSQVKGFCNDTGNWEIVITNRIACTRGKYRAWLSGRHEPDSQVFEYTVGPVIAFGPNSSGDLDKIVLLEFQWPKSGWMHGGNQKLRDPYSGIMCDDLYSCYEPCVSHVTYGNKFGYSTSIEGKTDCVCHRYASGVGKSRFPFSSDPITLSKSIDWGAEILVFWNITPKQVENTIIQALEKRKQLAEGVLGNLQYAQSH